MTRFETALSARRADPVRRAFTLIEVLIVVVIIAVLAAVVISHAVVSTDDAKTSTLKHNLYILRAQIEMYKLTHNGAVPTLQNGTLAQLVLATNAGGQTGAAGPSYPLGPYIAGGRFPVNPFDQQNTVSSTAVFPPTASTSAGGWLYHEPTGQIAANTNGHLND
jgi:general secretion pathway protein G